MPAISMVPVDRARKCPQQLRRMQRVSAHCAIGDRQPRRTFAGMQHRDAQRVACEDVVERAGGFAPRTAFRVVRASTIRSHEAPCDSQTSTP